MSTQILYGLKEKRAIGSLELDVVISENHQIKNQVTQFPVERGVPISDHIRLMPDRISMTCFITDTPIIDTFSETNNIQTLISENSSQNQIDQVRSLSAFLRLEELAKGIIDENGFRVRTLLTVVTGLKIYTDMAIETVNIPRIRGTGASLRFTCNLVNVRIVEPRTVELPNLSQDTTGAKAGTDKQGQSTSNKGKSNTKQPENSSLIIQGLNAVGINL